MRGLEWIPKDIKKAWIKYTHVYKNYNYAIKRYLYIGYEYKGQYYDHNKCQREVSRELRSHYLEKNKWNSLSLDGNDYTKFILFLQRYQFFYLVSFPLNVHESICYRTFKRLIIKVDRRKGFFYWFHGVILRWGVG